MCSSSGLNRCRSAGAVILLAGLALAGCASLPQFELTQTLELPGTGYTMDYPAGWYVEIMEPLGAAVVSQNEAALADGIFGGDWTPKSGVAHGYGVWLQRTSRLTAAFWADFMGSGRPTESARDMIRLSKMWGWQEPEPAAIRDVVVAGVDASMAELPPPPSAALFYVAIAGPEKDVYILRVMAPTTKELERFKPTWEKMLASIKPAKP